MAGQFSSAGALPEKWNRTRRGKRVNAMTSSSFSDLEGTETARAPIWTSLLSTLTPDIRNQVFKPKGLVSRLGFAFVPDHLIFGLRSSCERVEFMLALVMRWAPVSTLAGTCSPFEAASAVLTPS
jgi:hypothetical protein